MLACSLELESHFQIREFLCSFYLKILAKTALLRKIHALQTPLVGQLNLFKLQDGWLVDRGY
jgi:hypothetical protein